MPERQIRGRSIIGMTVIARYGGDGWLRSRGRRRIGGKRLHASCLDVLGAERIDHGLSVLDDPELTRRLADRRIPLTVCPTSNIRIANAVQRLEDHPYANMRAAGLLATLNTDDPAMIDLDLATTGADGSRVGDRYRLITTLLDHRCFPDAALMGRLGMAEQQPNRRRSPGGPAHRRLSDQLADSAAFRSISCWRVGASRACSVQERRLVRSLTTRRRRSDAGYVTARHNPLHAPAVQPPKRALIGPPRSRPGPPRPGPAHHLGCRQGRS